MMMTAAAISITRNSIRFFLYFLFSESDTGLYLLSTGDNNRISISEITAKVPMTYIDRSGICIAIQNAVTIPHETNKQDINLSA